MKSLNRLVPVSVLAITFFIFSCRKDQIITPQESQSPNLSTEISGIPSPSINWEGMDPLSWGPINNIWAPWAGSVPRQFPIDYIEDYRSFDGWELYLNTFTSAEKASNPYFILYNRYRGVLRIYYYMASSSSTETSKITFQLDMNGSLNNSKMLSFEQGEIITQLFPSVISKIQPFLVVQGGAWYAEEFELAYDPALAQQEYSLNQLRVTMFATNVTQYSISGTQSGTIDGTIESPASSSSLFGSLFKGAVSVGAGQLGLLATGSKVAGKFFSHSFGPIKLERMKQGIDGAANDAIKKGGTSIFNALLSSISGGNAGTPSQQKVNLKINTDVSLTGTGVSSPSGIFTQSFFVSNTLGLQERAVGYIPLYQKSLGIFSLSGTPTVNLKYAKGVKQPVKIRCDYSIDESSFNIDFNQDLFNDQSIKGAKVANLKKEVVLLDIGLLKANSYVTDISAEEEYVSVNSSISAVLTGEDVWFSLEGPHSFGPPVDAAIRISFDVVPNNGSARTTVVKTFKANLRRTNVSL